ncbi:alpha/beta hydrolase [Pricia sp. S334]|uniref:Alpha/beta hydrolase n=1 Tax=Pricia mediterranea TaxID=3076079 RepID=A0ABU3L912_9FLAO|nr:alpha/beta hydrolase [Pricia sp. S334]MDT7829718.1 alpha/beta hydrolase [Pricia sp. S334]
MKQLFTMIALGIMCYAPAQQISLRKGTVVDSLPVSVSDTISETFSLYLPKKFEVSSVWPVLFVFDMQGRGQQALKMAASAAEEQGYILAASDHLRDTLPISDNILIANRMINAVVGFLPIHKDRIYVGGFAGGGRFSTLVPSFIKGVQGVLVSGATVANTDLLASKNPFHLIGIVGNADYNYPEMMEMEELLNRMKFPNQLLLFEGGHQWPETEVLSNALEIFTLSAMAKGRIPRDEAFIRAKYDEDLTQANIWFTANKPLLANNRLDEMLEIYAPFYDTDAIRDSQKTLKKSKIFKTRNRHQNDLLFQERLIKEDYVYYLEEDILTYNYNNLGWWKYQMEELEKFNSSKDELRQLTGKRLEGYINALVADNIDIVKAGDPVDEEALNFLWMLNTVIDPRDYGSYLKIISYNAKVNDNGTALFYLEELLKNGYADKDELYALEDTALLRLTPEFNDIVGKYLKEARYDWD